LTELLLPADWRIDCARNSEFIREAMKLYIQERKRRTIREQMKKGYIEMAKINLALAGENFALEHEVSKLYSGRLSGDE